MEGFLNCPNLVKIYKNAARRCARRRLFYIFCLNSMLSNRVLQTLINYIIISNGEVYNEKY